MSADRELLELAAKAVGMHVLPEGAPWPDEREGWFFNQVGDHPPALYDRATMARDMWAPLTDDGDALRLGAAIEMELEINKGHVYCRANHGCREGFSEFDKEDTLRAMRRAIVRTAAAIGKAMP